MASTTAKGGGSTVNNGGTVVNAGNVSADNPITKVIGVNELNTGADYGSKVLVNTATGDGSSDPQGVGKAKTSGTFAYSQNADNFLLRAAGDTRAGKINGSASDLLTVPGGVSNVSIHKLVTTRQLGTYATASYNVLATPSTDVVPGRTKGDLAGSGVNYVQADDGSSAASDDAATPSRSVPGELTYHFGSLGGPTTDEYKARDSYEV